MKAGGGGGGGMTQHFRPCGLSRAEGEGLGEHLGSRILRGNNEVRQCSLRIHAWVRSPVRAEDRY